MTHADIDSFSSEWNKFTTKVKGKLLKESKRKPVDYHTAEEILRETKVCWSSPYEATGRWLKGLSEKDSDKGTRIIAQLDKIHFEEIAERKSPLPFLLFIIPLLFGAGGFLIAMFLTQSWLIRIASAVLPAALMFFTTKIAYSNIKSTLQKRLISKYMDQLDVYSDKIKKILKST